MKLIPTIKTGRFNTKNGRKKTDKTGVKRGLGYFVHFKENNTFEILLISFQARLDWTIFNILKIALI